MQDGTKIGSIACGAHHSILLTQNGLLYAWGRNKAGQLGEPQGGRVHRANHPGIWPRCLTGHPCY